MIHPARVQPLNSRPEKNGQYVIYWMQASQRLRNNHALEWAIRKANEKNVPLLVYFQLVDDFPEANARHYHFMLQGLKELSQKLTENQIAFLLHYKSFNPDCSLEKIAQKACLVVTDRGYLRFQREWRRRVSLQLDCPLVQIESDVIVPVEMASPKQEFSAGTFRPKILSLRDEFLVPLKNNSIKNYFSQNPFESLPLDDVDQIVLKLKIDQTVKTSPLFKGGEKAALDHLRNFVENKILNFDENRNDPSLDVASHLSPYLHFGQISPLTAALAVIKIKGPGRNSFMEELIVRRELAMNYVYYNPQYDLFDGLHSWAKKSLDEHKKDVREKVYSFKEFESYQTHDPYWNAAQKEMVVTGKMHGYLRMYWGKKILEWSQTPQKGFAIALALNNKYQLDGRDPNSFAGVAWCFGQHDRAWSEREVFGKIRYMNANGLKRKFDIDAYVERINAL